MTKTKTERLPMADLDEVFGGTTWLLLVGVDPEGWAEGFTELMKESGIGEPRQWYRSTGARMNAYLWPNDNPRNGRHDYFKARAGFAMCSLDGLDPGRLAMLRLRYVENAKWSDDFLANQRGR